MSKVINLYRTAKAFRWVVDVLSVVFLFVLIAAVHALSPIATIVTVSLKGVL